MAKTWNEYPTNGNPHIHYIDAASQPVRMDLPSADGTQKSNIAANINKSLYMDAGSTVANPEATGPNENTVPQLNYAQYMDTGLTTVPNPESNNYSAEGTP